LRPGDIYEEVKDLEHLRTKVLGRPLLITEDTASTNDDAKLLADENLLGHGAVLLSRTQSRGKGRLGRRWASPRGGVFMSIILQPDLPPAQVPGLSLAVGYSVARALRESFDLDAKIKWPNDVLVSGRKICGVLCEMKAEQDRVHYVVAGIGVNANLRPDDFPPEVKDTATSLAAELGHNVDQDLVVASILNYFEPVYEEYVQRGLTDLAGHITSVAAYLGERVVVHNRTLGPGSQGPEAARLHATGSVSPQIVSTETGQEGVFVGIDESGRLLLDMDGVTKAFDVGDVSLRSV